MVADEGGNRRYLDEVREGVRDVPGVAGLVEMLIARKRGGFSQDRRRMMLEGIAVTAGRADVRVSWTIA